MENKVRKLYPQRGNEPGEACLAQVAAVEKGLARTLTLRDGETVDVFAHLSEVPLLRVGDRVLVQILAEGAVVTGRLRQPGDAPAPLLRQSDGRLEIEAAGGLCLQTGAARVELTPDGRIWIDGTEVTHIASGSMRLLGATIELN